jgi:hypothetical protein
MRFRRTGLLADRPAPNAFVGGEYYATDPEPGDSPITVSDGLAYHPRPLQSISRYDFFFAVADADALPDAAAVIREDTLIQTEDDGKLFESFGDVWCDVTGNVDLTSSAEGPVTPVHGETEDGIAVLRPEAGTLKFAEVANADDSEDAPAVWMMLFDRPESDPPGLEDTPDRPAVPLEAGGAPAVVYGGRFNLGILLVASSTYRTYTPATGAVLNYFAESVA